MPRNRTSAKKAGTQFERKIADHLAQQLNDERIDRRAKTGAKDKGDIAGVRDSHDRKITIECKNTTRLNLPDWLRQAETERHNADDYAGIVIHKRHGNNKPQDQYATMTVETLIKLLTA